MGVWISLIVFLVTTGLVVVAYLLLNRDNRRMTTRLRMLGEPAGPTRTAGDWFRDALGSLPMPAFVVGSGQNRNAQLRQRFIRAGIYGPKAVTLFLAARFLLVVAGVALAVGAGLANVVPPNWVLPSGVFMAGIGLLVPGLWLDARIGSWQAALRRGLPDAMDMLVLCLEGGASFVAAFQYVVGELRLAHPQLGGELEIVQSEMMLGKTAGESLQQFAQRCDLEELRTLAGVLLQNERFGVSVAKALRIHADAMRQQRLQRAEEAAQQAAVKILFPTLLCIFPAIFIVVLGPAAFRIMAVMNKMR